VKNPLKSKNFLNLNLTFATFEEMSDMGGIGSKGDMPFFRIEGDISSSVGWRGSLSREDAEKLLQDRPIGTYLLRARDEESCLSVDRLSQVNHCSIEHFLLTYVESDQRVSEKLILQVPWGWLVMHDDPNLRDSSYRVYESPKELMKDLSVAKYPLEKRS
jgi:hypothetical protein